MRDITPEIERQRTDRAVSPVIGVILMVAITVILAAVIGTFVLNLGQSVEGPVQAGASVVCDAANDEIRVTYTSAQDTDTTLDVQLSGANSDSATLSSIGAVNTFTNLNTGTTTVTVTANLGDASTVVVSKECSL